MINDDDSNCNNKDNDSNDNDGNIIITLKKYLLYCE